MPGAAAVAIWCDVAPEVKDEYDDWHVHEHTPERLAIPGFQRGSRWVSIDGRNAYFMLYELEALSVLTDGPYLERLDNPTPWSAKMMPHHRNMVRSLCRVQASYGAGLGKVMLTIRFSPQSGSEERLAGWLGNDLLPGLVARKGLAAAHFLRDAGQVQGGTPTTEQKLRGGDGAANWILLVNGYETAVVEKLASGALGDAEMGLQGAASGRIARVYELAYTLSRKSGSNPDFSTDRS